MGPTALVSQLLRIEEFRRVNVRKVATRRFLVICRELFLCFLRGFLAHETLYDNCLYDMLSFLRVKGGLAEKTGVGKGSYAQGSRVSYIEASVFQL